jgi:putative RecB family exonuclease
MSVWQNFSDVQVDEPDDEVARRRMSMTSDVLAFRHCRRQYGYFSNDNFVPTQTTQIFFGKIIHQVLDRAHRHYKGLVPGVDEGSIPTEENIEEYFREVENALITRGVRPKSGRSRDQALEVIKRFNDVEGETLYPRVFDTEYKLESSQEDYILHGVVDVIADGDADENDPSGREIWDYKGSSRPAQTSQQLRNYEWQMAVYAHLYRARTGVYPDRAVLYFMNELAGDPPPERRPRGAIYSVDFSDDQIQRGLQEFDTTAQGILQHKERQEWPAPEDPPGEETCDVCDIRFDCPTREDEYSLRYPVSEDS